MGAAQNLDIQVRRVLVQSLDVLLVDDAYQTRVAIKQVLVSLGATRFAELRTIAEAREVSLYRKFSQAFISTRLLDPEMSFVRELKERAGDSCLCVTLLTDQVTRPLIEQAHAAGVMEIVVSPFSTERIVKCLVRGAFGG